MKGPSLLSHDSLIYVRAFGVGPCQRVGFFSPSHYFSHLLLIYDSFAHYLVTEKGYDKELLTVTPESWDFCCKELALDLEDGNFLKVAGAGTILRASHSTKSMTPAEILEVYGRREWKHFKTFSRMVSHSGALLCARIVDWLDKHVRQTKYNFWKDVIAAIQHNYKTSAFKGSSDLSPPRLTVA
uniref:Uncharacterized protein n=1 Tax=Chelonoidis abingdonii TaxID=106734 RepID=A0A8C0G540_CHEAB